VGVNRPKLYVYDGQPGLAAIVNRLIDLCQENQIEAEGGYTDADTLWPSQILDVIEGREPRG
jgi:hypothetical protein